VARRFGLADFAERVQLESDFFPRERRPPSTLTLLARAAEDGRLGEAIRNAAGRTPQPTPGLVTSESGLFTSDFSGRRATLEATLESERSIRIRVRPNLATVADGEHVERSSLSTRSRSPNPRGRGEGRGRGAGRR
jgi:hypothetical protein